MITGFQAALHVARKEFMEHVRTRRLLIMGVCYLAALLLGLFIGIRITDELLGSGGRGGEGVSVNDRVVFVLGFYFGAFPIIGGVSFTSALGVVMSADAICGEWKDRTLFLLLSKPVSRAAVLSGKILGAFAAVLGTFAVVFAVGLAIVIAAVGMPDGKTFGQILGGFALVGLAILPFIGLGILTSTMFRSTAASFLLAFGAWLLILPILGQVGLIIRLFQRSGERALSGDDGLVNFFHHLDPKWLMEQGATHMLGGRSFSIFGGLETQVDVPSMLLGVAAQTVAFLGLSYWIVARRDYA